MMKLADVVQQVLETKVLTMAVEDQIDGLLWSPEFDHRDQAALEQLIALLCDGTVKPQDAEGSLQLG